MRALDISNRRKSVLWSPEILHVQQCPNSVKIHFYLFVIHNFEFMAVFPIKMLNNHKNFLEVILSQNILSSQGKASQKKLNSFL